MACSRHAAGTAAAFCQHREPLVALQQGGPGYQVTGFSDRRSRLKNIQGGLRTNICALITEGYDK
jgi:hypothetical protein